MPKLHNYIIVDNRTHRTLQNLEIGKETPNKKKSNEPYKLFEQLDFL